MRISDGVNKSPYSDYFKLMGFETRHMVLNAGSNLELWVLLILAGIFIKTVYKYKAHIKNSLVLKILTKVDQTLRYKMIIRAMS